MTARKHTIRFVGADGRWQCSCDTAGYTVGTAEEHAHAVGGRIETAGAPR